MEGQAAALEVVTAEQAGAAAVGDHHQMVSLGGGLHAQGQGHVQELLPGGSPDGPRPLKDLVIESVGGPGVLAGGVGKSRLLADLGAAHLDGDNGLIHMLAGIHKGLGAVQALDVDGQTLGVGVPPGIGHELAEVHVRLIAQAHKEAHAKVVLLGGAQSGQQIGPRLGDHGHRALDGQIGDETAVEVQIGAAHAHQVGADEGQLVVPAVLGELILQFTSANLLKGAGGNDHDLHLFGHAVLQHGFDNVGWYGHKYQIHIIGNVFDSGVGGQALHHVASGVDGVQLSLVAPAAQLLNDLIAHLGGVSAGTHHGNGPGIQGILQVLNDIFSGALYLHVISPPHDWKTGT